MKVLDLKTNQEVDLPEQEVAARYLEGTVRTREGDRIPVVSNTGEVGSVDPASLHTAVESGFEITTQDHLRRAELEAVYGDAGSQVATGAEGLARGLTLGLYDAAAYGVNPEYAKEAELRAQVNPITAVGGEIAGAVLPALASGGSSTAASGAGLAARGVRAATALPRAATALGRVAGAGAERLVGAEAGSILGRVAQKAVRYGVEGAAESLPYALGHGISESVLHPERTSEQILAGVGYETLAGGLAGGILGGTAKLGSEAYQRVARSVFGESTHPGLGEALVKMSASMSGDDAANIRRLALGDSGEGLLSESAKRNRQVAFFDSGEIKNRVARDLTDSLDQARQALSEIQDNYKGLNKLDALEKLLPAETKAEQVAANRRFLRVAEEQLEQMSQGKGSVFKSQIKDLTDVVRAQRGRFEASLKGRGQTASGPQATGYAALDEVKRRLQGSIEAATQSLIRSPKVKVQAYGRQTIESLDGLQEMIRQHLMDETLFGAAAKAQKEVNDPWMRMIAANKNLSQRARLFEAYKAGEVGGYGNQWRANPERIASYLDGIVDPRKDLVHADLNQWIDQGEKFASAVRKYGTDDTVLSDALSRYNDAAKRVRGGLREAEDAIVLQNQAKALSTGGGLLDGGNSGLGLGAVAGMALDSVVPFAATSALGAARSAIAGLSAPGRTLRQLASIERLASGVGSKLDGGISRYITAVKNASKAGAYVSKKAAVRGAGMATRDKKDAKESNRKTYEKAKAQLAAAQADPEGLRQNLARSTRNIAQEAPELAKAVQQKALKAQDFLSSKLPPASEGSSPWKKSDPPDSEMAKFAKYVAATEDPVGTLTKELDSGTLSKETIETLDALYPTLAQDVRTKVTEAIASMDKPPPYAERVRLSILLGTPLDASLSPTKVAMYQSSYQQPDQPKPSPQGGSALGAISKSFETTMNRLSV